MARRCWKQEGWRRLSVGRCSGQQRGRIAARGGGEQVDEGGVQRAAVQAAGRGCREQPLDAALAVFGLAAEAELAGDDRAAEPAFGVVVGRLHAVDLVEGPQRGPEVKQVACEASTAEVACALAGVAGEERLQIAAQLAGTALEVGAVAGVLVDLPGPEQLLADPEARFAEVFLGREAVGVRGEVALQV